MDERKETKSNSSGRYFLRKRNRPTSTSLLTEQKSTLRISNQFTTEEQAEQPQLPSTSKRQRQTKETTAKKKKESKKRTKTSKKKMIEQPKKTTEGTLSFEQMKLTTTDYTVKNEAPKEEESKPNKYIIPQKRNPSKSQHIEFFETSEQDKMVLQVEEKTYSLAISERFSRKENWHYSGKKKKISIPDNWSDVDKIGGCMHSRFVAMRVPLDEKYNGLMKKDQWWTPQMFIDAQTKHGHQVGMVIDLTNTLKYYDGIAIFQDTTIEYVKLAIEGFKHPPRDRDVNQFIGIVDDFVTRRPEARIAVHCTHGLNRTGYMLVQYMVRRMGLKVKEALDAFSVARPPGLIKHRYVEALYTTLGKDEQVELPVLPKWGEEKYANRKH